MIDHDEIGRRLEHRLRDRAAKVSTPTDMMEKIQSTRRSMVRRRRAGRCALVAVPVLLVVGSLQLLSADTERGRDLSFAAAAMSVAQGGLSEAGRCTIIVWLHAGEPTNADIDLVGRSLSAARPGVASYRFIGPAEIYAEFQRYYADEPEVLRLFEPGDIPTNFVVEIAPDDLDRDIQSLVDELEGLGPVDVVERGPTDPVEPSAC